LAKSYEEQQQTYIQIIAMLKKQEEVMADLVAQDKVLEAQDIVLEEQTKLLKGGDDIFKESVMPIQSIPDLTAGCFQSHLIFIGTALIRNYPLRTPGLSSLPRTTKPRRPRSTRFVSM
jgi:hypothetical protein